MEYKSLIIAGCTAGFALAGAPQMADVATSRTVDVNCAPHEQMVAVRIDGEWRVMSVEDLDDIRASEAAEQEGGKIPYSEIRRELGLS